MAIEKYDCTYMVECAGNCYQNNIDMLNYCQSLQNIAFYECSVVVITLQCFASDLSVSVNNPYKLLICFMYLFSDVYVFFVLISVEEKREVLK